jgi:hypothetical protein
MKIKPSYIIHSSCCPERDGLVEVLRDESGAEVVEAVWCPDDPKKGCRESHKKIAQMAKDQNPNASYLVFEDDCEFVSLKWYYPSIAGDEVDLIYLGVNGYGTFDGDVYSYGTHAMIVSPKVRDLILEKTDDYINKVKDKGAFDHILNKMCHDHKISIWRPTEKDKERWVRQAKGYKSTITGNVR